MRFFIEKKQSSKIREAVKAIMVVVVLSNTCLHLKLI